MASGVDGRLSYRACSSTSFTGVVTSLLKRVPLSTSTASVAAGSTRVKSDSGRDEKEIPSDSISNPLLTEYVAEPEPELGGSATSVVSASDSKTELVVPPSANGRDERELSLASL